MVGRQGAASLREGTKLGSYSSIPRRIPSVNGIRAPTAKGTRRAAGGAEVEVP